MIDSHSSPWWHSILRCPDCAAHLDVDTALVRCEACGYRRQRHGQLDLRAQEPAVLDARLPRRAQSAVSDLDALDTTTPEITYRGPLGGRDSRELLSAAPSHLRPGARVFDHGCGPRDQAPCFELLGCQYVGADIAHPRADLLADAHALPFAEASFDCVFSYAVLEHLRSPVVAVHEIERVLAPGGVLLGTVSQGEPFHDSYFHPTAWGLLSLFHDHTTLRLQRLWPGPDTLHSLSTMGRYPRAIRWLIGTVAAVHARLPFLAPRAMALPEPRKRLERLYRAGSLCFVAEKAPAT